jgi:hypothetical protein
VGQTPLISDALNKFLSYKYTLFKFRLHYLYLLILLISPLSARAKTAKERNPRLRTFGSTTHHFGSFGSI